MNKTGKKGRHPWQGWKNERENNMTNKWKRRENKRSIKMAVSNKSIFKIQEIKKNKYERKKG